ncbi:MAG: dethiobiotin synthetase [Halothiobacillaceae bacterium]|nr:MAG: dethiobiotin synthetase [Halothiobacillaceae bacterium]
MTSAVTHAANSRLQRGFFITGTDTEIGKTTCSVLLINTLKQHGYHVAAMKPVAAGATLHATGLRNEDAILLNSSASTPHPYEEVNPYCFAEPIAPHLAAAKAKQTIDIENIYRHYQTLSGTADYTIVESVGGWHVPLSRTTTTIALAQRLNLPVILVVGIRLGCLNHALLTVNAIKQSGLPLAGWIANCIDPQQSCQQENIDYLSAVIPSARLGTIPYKEDIEREGGHRAESYLNLTPLLASVPAANTRYTD